MDTNFVIANVMIPSIAGHVVVMLILLFPIATIEGLVLARRHLLGYKESLALSLRANLRSTLVGLPMGYGFAFLGVIPAGLFAALLPEKIGSVIGSILFNVLGHGGTIPNEMDELGFYLGTLLVMIPYFLVTLRVERKQIVKMRNDLDTDKLTTTVRIMNDITYALLAIPLVIGAIMSVRSFDNL